MARYISDMNVTSLYYESGTFGSVSGTAQWLGQVQSFDPNDSEGIFQVRYQGTDTRNVNQYNAGPRDYDGTVTYYPQDWKMLMYALGSVTSTGSPFATHTIGELNNGSSSPWVSGTDNPFSSFTLQHAQKAPGTGLNYIRTYNGCVVNNYSLTVANSEIVNCEVNWIAQSVTYSSGAVTMPTENTIRPYLWSDAIFHLTSGVRLDDVNTFTFTVNNNMDPRHYDNGSRVIAPPVPGNRDYQLDLEIDATSEYTKILYDQYYLGGSEFNGGIALTVTAGSRQLWIALSGCRVTEMSAPGGLEGVNTQSVTIEPRSVVPIAIDQTTIRYAPW